MAYIPTAAKAAMNKAGQTAKLTANGKSTGTTLPKTTTPKNTTASVPGAPSNVKKDTTTGKVTNTTTPKQTPAPTSKPKTTSVPGAPSNIQKDTTTGKVTATPAPKSNTSSVPGGAPSNVRVTSNGTGTTVDTGKVNDTFGSMKNTGNTSKTRYVPGGAPSNVRVTSNGTGTTVNTGKVNDTFGSAKNTSSTNTSSVPKRAPTNVSTTGNNNGKTVPSTKTSVPGAPSNVYTTPKGTGATKNTGVVSDTFGSIKNTGHATYTPTPPSGSASAAARLVAEMEERVAEVAQDTDATIALYNTLCSLQQVVGDAEKSALNVLKNVLFDTLSENNSGVQKVSTGKHITTADGGTINLDMLVGEKPTFAQYVKLGNQIGADNLAVFMRQNGCPREMILGACEKLTPNPSTVGPTKSTKGSTPTNLPSNIFIDEDGTGSKIIEPDAGSSPYATEFPDDSPKGMPGNIKVDEDGNVTVTPAPTVNIPETTPTMSTKGTTPTNLPSDVTIGEDGTADATPAPVISTKKTTPSGAPSNISVDKTGNVTVTAAPAAPEEVTGAPSNIEISKDGAVKVTAAPSYDSDGNMLNNETVTVNNPTTAMNETPSTLGGNPGTTEIAGMSEYDKYRGTGVTDYMYNKTYEGHTVFSDTSVQAAIQQQAMTDEENGIRYITVDGLTNPDGTPAKVYCAAFGDVVASAATGEARCGDVLLATWKDGTSNYMVVGDSKGGLPLGQTAGVTYDGYLTSRSNGIELIVDKSCMSEGATDIRKQGVIAPDRTYECYSSAYAHWSQECVSIELVNVANVYYGK